MASRPAPRSDPPTLRLISMGDESLVAALGLVGCPLCGHVERQARRYLGALLYEHTTDRAFRDRFLAGGGFCAAHVRALVAADAEAGGDGVGPAIFLRSMVAARRRALEAAAGSRRAASLLAEAARPARACPVCEREVTVRDHAADRLAQHALEDPGWCEAVSRAPWCLSHLGALAVAAARQRSATGRLVVEAQLTLLAALEERLDALAHDSSHDRRAGLTDEARGSLAEATAFLAGTRRP